MPEIKDIIVRKPTEEEKAIAKLPFLTKKSAGSLLPSAIL